MEDINTGWTGLKKSIEGIVAASTVRYSEDDSTLDAAVQMGRRY
jgi:hypothetical protein